ncbi:NADH-FMN oxidoreductase RutF, flavin reductase (DIM6/NTAB) family [Thermostaphylospora chromogena]|uniref:NADH-FMN oxidoreductase RutF, flavin reductase (DIM6/NTAB) family n=1 Tax=Thermostaphylospora chromogena TaxID=35622 RepID=A0A1H1AJH3_9ACTN|nr:NADH-FMN oxidoreductase RutF, flavin reductase (DIM6/NTAB) family [Thermostaphylospora chromogena]
MTADGENVSELRGAMRHVAAAVSVVTVKEDRDDIGGTVNTFTSVSLDPPLVMVSLAGYLAEVLLRRDLWAATVLSAGQKAVASRFATPGRPSARILLAGTPHHRGPMSEALIVGDGVTAVEAETVKAVPAGDHVVFIARALRVDYVNEEAEPLLRLRGRYLSL